MRVLLGILFSLKIKRTSKQSEPYLRLLNNKNLIR